MSIFHNIKSAKLPNAHGEVNFLRVEKGTVDTSKLDLVTPDVKGYIVGHSEKGHNHILEHEGVTMRRSSEKGMDILYAIVENPVRLYQDAGSPHAAQIVEPGEYIITNNIQYNPWTEQARRVAD